MSFCGVYNMINDGPFEKADILNDIGLNLMTQIIENFDREFLENIINNKFPFTFED